MIKSGLLIVLSGPSGVGKDTVVQHYLSTNPGSVLSISATTRMPRPGEKDGKDYFFMTREDFGGKVARGHMLEYAEYNGNYYGTPKEWVDANLAAGKNVILVIEVQGAEQIKKQRPGAVFVFVAPPSWDCLRQRLQGRGTECKADLERRLQVAAEEICRATEYDYIIINDTVQQCSRKLETVVEAAACQTNYMSEFLERSCQDAQTINVSDHQQER